MDQEYKNLLEKNLEVSKKSLEILEKMQKAAMWKRIFTAAKWILIIGLIIFGFIQIKPYLLQLSKILENLTKVLENLNVFSLVR